jgi:hypothetical protein
MRKIISRALTVAGVAAGAVPAVLLIALSWPDLVRHMNDSHGLQNFVRCFGLAILFWWLVSWPFLWLAQKVCPQPVAPDKPAPVVAHPPPGAHRNAR